MSEYQEIQDRFVQVLDILIELDREIKKIDQQIAELKAQGMTSATIHWRRKDDPDGKPDMLELVHRQGSGYEREHNRRREYIGTDPKQIEKAIARCRRFDRVLQLERERTGVWKRTKDIRWSIKNVFRVAGVRQDLWGQSDQVIQSQVSPGAGGDNLAHREVDIRDDVSPDDGDNGDWGHQGDGRLSQVSPQANVTVSPKSVSPQSIDEVKAYFQQHSDPFMQSLANDIGKPISRR